VKSAVRYVLGVCLGGTLNLLLVAALALSLNTARAAVRDAAPPSYKVHYADLDLTTKAGAVALYWRLKWAAEDVCADPHGLQSIARVDRCIATAVGRAVAQINSPLLMGYYAVRVRHGNVLAELP
jgi:UrcA family protein